MADFPVNPNPEWITRGKTIEGLIRELQSFSDPTREVRISLDGGATHHCISLVANDRGKTVLINFENGVPDRVAPPRKRRKRAPG